MSKNIKRFISIILACAVCFSLSIVAMAAENEIIIAEAGEINSAYSTTVGQCVFSIGDYADSTGEQLKSTASQYVTCTKAPIHLSYVALPKSGFGTVYIKVDNLSEITLQADGKTHTINISDSVSAYDTYFSVKYYGATTSLVSISLVFSR